QAGLEPVPARRQRAGEIAHVLVVHAKERAELVLLHHLAGTFGAVAAQPVPIDALLPIEARDAEICRAHMVPPDLKPCGLTAGPLLFAGSLSRWPPQPK